MRTVLIALSGVAVALAAAPAGAEKPKTYVCTKWDDGICVSTHRVKGVAPFRVGHVFGPTYDYTAVTALPGPVVTHYKLSPDSRYVYRDGFVYVIDPTTYAVTRVLDTIAP
jgi:hypothetical protein